MPYPSNPLNKGRNLSEKFINNIKRITFWVALFSLINQTALYGISFIDMVTNEGLGLDWVAVKHSGWNIILSPFIAAVSYQVAVPLLLFIAITGLVLMYARLTQTGYFTYLRGQTWDTVVKSVWFASAVLMGIIYLDTILQTVIPHLHYSGLPLTAGVMSIPAIVMITIIAANFGGSFVKRRGMVGQSIQGTHEDN